MNRKNMRKNIEIKASAVSRFFASSLVKELANKRKSPKFSRLLAESGVGDLLSDIDTVGVAFERAFDFLKQPYFRHEYAYKAALTRNILLGRHSLNTASMLTEFRVGTCKADVVILNGTGTVYEVKSERDTLSRLENQLLEYRNVFATVNVIAGENHIDELLRTTPCDVGILKLTERQNISTVRLAKGIPERTQSESIFDAITLHEASIILKELELPTPEVPNTQKYQIYKEIFSKIPAATAHALMVKTMKQTRKQAQLAPFISKLPSSLQTVALNSRLKKTDFYNLFEVMKTPVSDAKKWGTV